MIWSVLFPFFLSPDDGGGASDGDDAGDDADDGDGDSKDNGDLDESIVAYLESKKIDASKATSTQIAGAIWAEMKGKEKQLQDEIKGRQGERKKRQAAERQLSEPKSLVAILEDSSTDEATKTEIRTLVEKASKATDFEEAVSQLVDNGTISNEIFEVLQAGPKATAAAFKAIGDKTGGKSTPGADSAGDALDAEIKKGLLNILGSVGKDLHQTPGDKEKGKDKSVLAQFEQVDPEVKDFITKMKGKKKKE